MPVSKIEVPEIGEVAITRKRGQKTIRLRVSTEGTVLISTPWLVPKAFALNFLESKKDWVRKQQNSLAVNFYDGMKLGKDSTLFIHYSSAARTRIKNGDLHVYLRGKGADLDAVNNAFIRKAVHKLLKKQCEQHILPRLSILSGQSGLSYNSAKVKQLIARWGSCDERSNISISLFLVQLPWEMIDYVLIHELAHTLHMNHGKSFWGEVAANCPNYKALRKEMRRTQPRIYDPKTFMQ